MKKQSFSKKMNFLLADEEDTNETLETNNETVATKAAAQASTSENEVQPSVAPAPVVTFHTSAATASSYDGSATDSIIGVNTRICGELTLTENIQILGQIDGNVTTTENVKICGVINGDVAATNITLDSGTVVGNVVATGSVFVSSNSKIVGDIKSENIIISGTTKGNITVSQSVKVKSSADHDGDICTNFIGIEEGCSFAGRITLNK